MPNTISQLFPEILRQAARWAQNYQQVIIEWGMELSAEQENDARMVGVQVPKRIRVLYVPHIPQPDDGLLKVFNEQIQLITPRTVGLTLHHGIFIRADCQSRRLLVHELVHVAQYERLGNIESFLRRYLNECFQYGYANAPMEQEANELAQRVS